MDVPEPDAVREALAHLEPRSQKIVGGMFAIMIKDPARVRDREWICEQLTQVALLAGEFEADTPDMGVAAVQAYLAENTDSLLNASYLLFQRVGLDLAPQTEAGFTYEDAMRSAMEYLPSA